MVAIRGNHSVFLPFSIKVKMQGLRSFWEQEFSVPK